MEEEKDPFAPIGITAPNDPAPLPGLPQVLGSPEEPQNPGNTFLKVDPSGIVGLYKMESGIPVKIRALGPLKQQVKLAIFNAALAPAREVTPEEMAQMSHVELAGYQLARAASNGDLDAIDKLFDRLIGKPKQSTESVRVNFNIDEALESEDLPKDVTPVQPLREFEEQENNDL